MAPLELKLLRSFAHVARELHFGRAAKAANVSQSSLTTQIQRLEDILGVRLFERNNRNVRLTPAGATLLDSSNDLFLLVDTIVAATRKTGSATKATLRIGYSTLALNTPMTNFVRRFREQYPGVELVLLEYPSHLCEEGILNDKFDCAFVPNTPVKPGIAHVLIHSTSLLACYPAFRQASLPDEVTLDDLLQETILLPEEQTRYADFVDEIFSGKESPKIKRAPISNVPALLTLVAAGAGVGLLLQSSVPMVPADVVARRIPAHIRIPFYLVWNGCRYNEQVIRLAEICDTSGETPATSFEASPSQRKMHAT